MNEHDVEEIIGERLDGISQALKAISQQQQDLGSIVSRLDEAIRGNGKPGLNQEVAVLKQQVNALETTDKRMLAIFGGIGTVVGGLLVVLGEYILG